MVAVVEVSGKATVGHAHAQEHAHTNLCVCVGGCVRACVYLYININT